MKKLLSIILACAMIMSLFCVAPVAATGEAFSETNPYLFYDFEDGVGRLSTNKVHSTEIADGGVNGSAKSTKITVTAQQHNSNLYDMAGNHLGFDAKIGDVLKGSFWMKLAAVQAEDSLGKCSMFFWNKTEAGTGGYTFMTEEFDTQSTDWQKIEFEHTFTKDYLDNAATDDAEGVYGFAVRMNPNGNTGNTAADGTENCTYYIDDLELKLVHPYNAIGEAPAAHVVDLFQGDSESWDGITATSTGSTDVFTVVDGTDSDAAPAGSKYLRVERNASGTVTLRLPMTDNLKANHVYKVTFKERATNVRGSTNDPVKYAYINNQLRYKHQGLIGGHTIEDKDGYDGGTRWAPNSYLDQYNTIREGSTTYTMCHVDARYSNLSSDTTVGNFATWKTIDWFIYSDKENIMENLSSDNYITIQPTIDYTANELCTFDFDDFHIYDYGAFTGAGFEYPVTSGGNVATYRSVNGLRSSGSAPANYFGWNLDSGTTTSWNGVNVTDGPSAQVTTITDSLYDNAAEVDGQKQGILYGKLTDDAKIWQYVPMLNDRTYTFTMPIRGVKMQGAGEETSSFHPFKARLVLERDATNVGANEIYDVSSKTKEVGEWVTIDSGTYKTVSITTDNTFPLIAGKTELDGYIPKTAKLSIEFANVDSYDGDVFAEKVHACYMDGGTMALVPDLGIPSVTEVEATTAANGAVALSYTYSATGGTATDSSFYKLYDGTTAIATFTDKTAIVIPEAYRRSSNLKLEIVPISSEGLMADAVTIAIEAAPIEGIKLTPAVSGVTVATDTALTGAKLIFVTYDANSKMVDWEAVDVTLAAQGTQDYAPVELTSGNYTRAMLWTDMAKCIPLADMVQY